MTQERWDKTRENLSWISKQGGVIDEFTPSEFQEVKESATSSDPKKMYFKTTESFLIPWCT